jgi:hypothetical protein
VTALCCLWQVLLVNYEAAESGVPRPLTVRVQPPRHVWRNDGEALSCYAGWMGRLSSSGERFLSMLVG